MHIAELKKQDEYKVMQFAAKGMHFSSYVRPVLLGLYSRYFWYFELTRATQVIAVYEGEQILGVVLASMNDEKPVRPSALRSLYVHAFDIVQKIISPGARAYERVNKEMLAEFKKTHSPAGEVTFLATDVDASVRGVGTMLLDELARREAGKEVFLYTDTGCSYTYYSHKGFTQEAKRNISIGMGKAPISMDCFLFSRVL